MTTMTASMTARPDASDLCPKTGSSANALRPVLLTVLSLKLAVAAFLLASVSISPPLSAESRYLATSPEIAAAN